MSDLPPRLSMAQQQGAGVTGTMLQFDGEVFDLRIIEDSNGWMTVSICRCSDGKLLEPARFEKKSGCGAVWTAKDVDRLSFLAVEPEKILWAERPDPAPQEAEDDPSP